MSSDLDTHKIPSNGYKPWQLIKLYGIGYKCWIGWIEPHKEKIGPLRSRRYTKEQVMIIFEILGEP